MSFSFTIFADARSLLHLATFLHQFFAIFYRLPSIFVTISRLSPSIFFVYRLPLLFAAHYAMLAYFFFPTSFLVAHTHHRRFFLLADIDMLRETHMILAMI
jgi:hypothetical protein